MKQYFDQLKGIFEKLTKTQKVAIGVVGFLFVSSLIAVMIFRGSSNWTVLFDNLSEVEAAALTKKIRELGFQAKYENTRIRVKSTEKSNIKFQLASENALPKQTTGYAQLFDNKNLMSTPHQVQELNLIRGKQGELEAVFSQIKQVKKAIVNLAIPSEKLWKEDQNPVTASIMLKLRSFTHLEKNQIQGIVNMACHAVEGLKKENVSVTDDLGNELTEILGYKDGDSLSSRKAKQMQFQERFENNLKKKALKMLEKMLGQGKAIVSVTATLNFDQIERSFKKYSPPVKGEESGVLESRKTETETYEGTGPKPNGVPGTESNTNPSYQRADKANGSKYSRSNDINNYLYDVLSEHHIPSGGIERLCVAVVLDEDIDLETNKRHNNFTSDELENFKHIISAAVGLDSQRGDIIRIHSRAFDKREQLRRKKQFESIEYKEQLRFWIPVIMMILIFVILPGTYWLLKKRREHKERLRKKEEERRKRAEKIKAIEPPISLEDQELLDVQEKVRQAAIENPDQFADLLRLWLTENE